jgi:transcriptional regulator with XRE-family HTH domain
MSQAELAQAIEVSDVTVGNWETGRSLPRAAALERLEIEFELAAGELVKLRAAQERQRLYAERRKARNGRRRSA